MNPTPERLSRTAATIAVLEAVPRWGPELQRQFLDEDVTVRVRARVPDVVELLKSGAISLVLINFEGIEAGALQLLGILNDHPAWQVPCLAVAPEKDDDLEWAVRELGAAAFLLDPVRIDRLTELIRRYLRRPPVPRPPSTLSSP